MAALPGLPLRVGMDIYNWAEDKLEGMSFPSMKHLYNRGLEFCRDHPVAGLFLALTTITTLGPLTLLAAFLLFTNTCLLLGFALIEFFIITAGLSVFIPVFLVGVLFSVTLTSGFTIMGKIWMGNNQKKDKLRKHNYNEGSDDFKSAYARHFPVKIEEVANKMTQTVHLVEKTGQARRGSCGQIEQVSLSKLMDEELTNTELMDEEQTNTDDFASRIANENQ